jgi:drug/metabolite transporter (DMT)-like permease
MDNKLRGSILIGISAFFYASYGIWSRLMMGSFGEFNQAWIRGLLLLLILVPFGLWKKKIKKIERQDLRWFIVIALSGGLNQAPYFYGFEHLPVGTATLLFYTMLIIGAYLIGKFFFGEKINFVKYLSLFLAIIGLSVIYSFSISSNQLLPAIATILAGLMGASVVVFSKKLSSNYSETQILSSVFGVMFVSNLIISLGLKEGLPDLSSLTPVLGQLGYTGAMLLANSAVVAGFKHLEPSIGALIGLLEVIFAIGFGLLFFGEILSIGIVMGTILVIFAIALPDLKRIVEKI